MVGTGRGAENGILIRDGAALETAHKLDTVVLDKTGTITEGRPSVVAVIAANGAAEGAGFAGAAGETEDELLRLAAGAERGSEHPLGRAVVAAAEARGLSVPAAESFAADSGYGVRAVVDGHDVLVGREAYVANGTVGDVPRGGAVGDPDGGASEDGCCGVAVTSAVATGSVAASTLATDPVGAGAGGDQPHSEVAAQPPGETATILHAPLSAELQARLSALREDGATPVFVAVDGRPAGVVAIADAVKPSSREAVARLKRLGLEVVMLTGDNTGTAAAVGRRVGADRIIAEVVPRQKAAEIKALQAAGRRLAMVGDGINDAPALAQADIGIAIGTGADVAIEAGDVTLISGDLSGVATAISLSRQTMRVIKQNLFWAFAYNVVLIPVAAGALYPFFGLLLDPVFAAAAMGLSSVSVVSNALRLRGFRPHA